MILLSSSSKVTYLCIQACRVSFAIIIACMTIQTSVSMSIFTMRLCLIYAMQPIVRRFLVLCLLLTVSSFVAFQVLTLHHALPIMTWNPRIHLCLILEYETWALGAAYIAPIFMESIIFLATLLHALLYIKTSGNVNRSTREILQRLYIDGTQYYLLLLAFRLGTVLVYYLAPPGLQLMFNQFEYFVSSTLTSRYFLSFRRQIINSQTMRLIGGVSGLSESVSVSAHISSPARPETTRDEVVMGTMQSA
ncbi:hypothetical protein FRC18_007937 [Serendipita sp. 400]|nr:hypothetical protein FRC18_007937 [Serendipita sp. 400]